MFTVAALRAPVPRLSLRAHRVTGLRQTSFFPSRKSLYTPQCATTSTTTRAFTTEISANLKVGQKLDDFPEYFSKVTSSKGGTVTLSSFKDTNPVVLFFYPKAGTPGCTKQAQTFRDQYDQLKQLDAVVFGISGDTLDEQKTFASAQNLPFPLLVDAGNALRQGFGVPGDLFGALPGRQTIVIDKSGTCILSYNNQFKPESHAQEAIKALSKA